MRQGNLKALRGRLEALERATRFGTRGVWISPEEVAKARDSLRQRLGLPRVREAGLPPGFVWTPATAARSREKLQDRIEALKAAAASLSPNQTTRTEETE